MIAICVVCELLVNCPPVYYMHDLRRTTTVVGKPEHKESAFFAKREIGMVCEHSSSSLCVVQTDGSLSEQPQRIFWSSVFGVRWGDRNVDNAATIFGIRFH